MGDGFKKVQTGENLKIAAETFNTMIDAALDFKARQQGRGQDAQRRFYQSGIFPVRNASGTDRDQFDVVAVGSPIIGPSDNLPEFKNRPALVGTTPSGALVGGDIGRFGILQEPCKAGEIVSAVISGVTVAKVYVTAEWHEKADVRNGTCASLISAEQGSATILWKEAGLGLRWAIVRLDDWIVTEFWAKLGVPTSLGYNRWQYPFVEVQKADTGYGNWQPGGFGRSGYAYNTVEDPNDGQGQEGNGVDIDRLIQCICGESSSGSGAPCCRLLPAGTGAIVRMKEVRFGYGSQPTVEYWFQFENEVDCCPTGSSSSGSSSSSSSSSSGSGSSSSGGSSSGSGSSSGPSSSGSGSSGSSSGPPSSSGSGSSSGSSSGPVTKVTVVTGVECLECAIRIKTREITLPAGATLGDEQTQECQLCDSSSGDSSSGTSGGTGSSS